MFSRSSDDASIVAGTSVKAVVDIAMGARLRWVSESCGRPKLLAFIAI